MIDAAARPPPEKMFRIAEQRVVREQVRQGRRVHVRDRDVRQRPEDQQDPEREEELAPDVRRAEGGDDRLDQASDSLSLSLFARPVASALVGQLARRSSAVPRRPLRPRPASCRAAAAAAAPWPLRLALPSPALSPRPALPRPPRRSGALSGQLRRWTVLPAAASLSSADRLKACAWIVMPVRRVADAEDLHRQLRVADQAVVREHVGRDERALLDLAEAAEVERRVLDAAAVLKPCSFGVRTWSGVWPPSNQAGRLPPARDFWPFVPRPAVLPRPGAMAAADAARRLARPGSRVQVVELHFDSSSFADVRLRRRLLDLEEEGDAAQHAADHRACRRPRRSGGADAGRARGSCRARRPCGRWSSGPR